MRARIRKTKKSGLIAKPVKTFDIDGFSYKTRFLMQAHEEFQEYKNKKIIKNFSLPMVNDSVQKNKFGAHKAKVDDIQFDSVMEAKYYVFLLIQKKDKKIRDFQRQVCYQLQEGYKDSVTKKRIQALNYICDFMVTELDGSTTIIDIKGTETPDFKIKKKLFGFVHKPLSIICVQWDDKSRSWKTLDEIKKEERELRKKTKLKK